MEDELLMSFNGNILQEQLCGRIRVQVWEKVVYFSFILVGQFLVEVDKFSNVGNWIVVGVLFGSLWFQYVGNNGCVVNFLVSYVLDQELVFGINVIGIEFFIVESCKILMEEIKFDLFLVKSQC